MDNQNRNFKINLNYHSQTTLSEQIQVEMQRLLQEGHWLPGDRLPTVREVAAHSGVNFNTVARAYRALDQDGWIVTWQGRGSYVLERKEINNEAPAVQANEHIASLQESFRSTAQQLGLSLANLFEILEQQLLPTAQIPEPPHKRKNRINKKQSYARKRTQPCHYERRGGRSSRPVAKQSPPLVRV